MVITLNKNRIFSGLLAVVYIMGGFAAGGGEGGCKVLLFVVLPLACIWFGEAMGNYTGLSGSIWINAPSPELFICLAGWMVLLLPILFVILNRL